MKLKNLIPAITLLAIMIVLTIAAANYSVNDLDGDPGFETAVEIIKKYETLHTPRNWPYIGYGHRVLPGEKYTPEKPLKHAQAEALLRKDLKKFIRMFPDHSKDDAILLATLSYNIGPSAVKRSQVYSLIEGDEEILRTSYLRHCKYKGKFHSQLHQRRIEEFEALYHFSEKNTLPSDPTVADASAEQQTSESTDTATAIAASTLPTDLTDTQR